MFPNTSGKSPVGKGSPSWPGVGPVTLLGVGSGGGQGPRAMRPEEVSRPWRHWYTGPYSSLPGAVCASLDLSQCPGLSPLDARAHLPPPVRSPKNTSRYCQTSLSVQSHPRGEPVLWRESSVLWEEKQGWQERLAPHPCVLPEQDRRRGTGCWDLLMYCEPLIGVI